MQPGNPWGESCVEFNPELMALVSTLSTGPVGPADKVGLVNASLVLQTCRADGLLLKPAEPLAPMDAAAAQLNVTVQYCMAQPQHVLQSAALPRVTNGRASKDYNADRDQWSYFPLNAMLYGAVGVSLNQIACKSFSHSLTPPLLAPF